ncbi:hypothetical protein [Klebsiella michiganensis]
MTTDINELAQRLAQRLATCAKEGAYPALSPAECGALAEALEKAQNTIAEMESRTVTVKLPAKIERNDADGGFMHKGGRVGGGAAEWYNKALDDVGSELAAAGIKWEAE